MALTTVVTFAGNLTADPELKSDRNGKALVRVSVAANPRKFNRDTKEWEDGEPVYMRGTAFGELAEHIGHSLRKGTRIIMHGTLKQENWENKETGVKQSAIVMQIEDLGVSLQFTNVTTSKSAPSQRADTGPADGGWTSAGVDDDTPF